jgi:hypothetical protein
MDSPQHQRAGLWLKKAGTVRRKYLFTIPQVAIIVLFTTLVSAATALAATGMTDSPAAPSSTNSYTLENIYQRLHSGTAGSQSAFTEPSVAPGTGTMHDLNTLMAIAPALDNTNGAIAAEVPSGKTFWGLTNGEWGLQTGTQLPRFTDNGDGTVTDNNTGILWLKNANCFGRQQIDSAFSLAFNLAPGECGLTANILQCGLPSLMALYSLLDIRNSPSLPSGHPFINVQPSSYWSSTYNVADGMQQTHSYYYSLDFNAGNVNLDIISRYYYVWPICMY